MLPEFMVMPFRRGQQCWWRRTILALAAVIAMGRAGAAPGGTDSNFVVAVPQEGLVAKPANLFNLEGKTVRFTPQAKGGYLVQLLARAESMPTPQLLTPATAVNDAVFEARGWEVPLAFSFPFGGRNWSRIYVNRNGNISFEKHEGAYWARRNPWPDGGMRSVAAAIDSNSAAGLEQMIAVLWNVYDSDPRTCQVHIASGADQLTVTWDVVRGSEGQAIAGPCKFQARLYPTGVVELVYLQVPERDGIVGLFTGQTVTGARLHHWQAAGSAAEPSVAMESGDIYDEGSVLKFVMTMKNDLPENVTKGYLAYRCMAQINGHLEQFAANLHETPDGSSSVGASPRTVGYRLGNRTVEFFVSKVQLTGIKQFAPSWKVTWWDMNRYDHSPESLGVVDLSKLAPPETDFVKVRGVQMGNIFAVYHYAAVTKNAEDVLKSIYQKLPAKDDIALVFTDFRIDDLFGQGGGARPSNFPIKGIGPEAASPRSTADIGSTQLQSDLAMVWMGSPLFAETGTTPDGHKWQSYARGVCWIAHESTHRWGMKLAMLDPGTGQEIKLGDDVGHWVEGLFAPAQFSVAGQYLLEPQTGNSIMGGSVWKENPDHTFTKIPYPYGIPGGLSALDLYTMGLLPAEKVPDTFILTNLKDLGGNRYQGQKVPVRIRDIVADLGPRIPASDQAQKSFSMKVYLIHESNHPGDPAMLERARKISTGVANFFSLASGGEMKVVPSK